MNTIRNTKSHCPSKTIKDHPVNAPGSASSGLLREISPGDQSRRFETWIVLPTRKAVRMGCGEEGRDVLKTAGCDLRMPVATFARSPSMASSMPLTVFSAVAMSWRTDAYLSSLKKQGEIERDQGQKKCRLRRACRFAAQAMILTRTSLHPSPRQCRQHASGLAEAAGTLIQGWRRGSHV